MGRIIYKSIVSESKFTEILVIRNISFSSDKQLRAAFMAVTVVTVLFFWRPAIFPAEPRVSISNLCRCAKTFIETAKGWPAHLLRNSVSLSDDLGLVAIDVFLDNIRM